MVFVYYSVNTVSVGLVAQLCPVLPDSVNCIRLLYGIILARIPEWVAIPYSRESSNPGIDPVTPAAPASAGGFCTS